MSEVRKLAGRRARKSKLTNSSSVDSIPVGPGGPSTSNPVTSTINRKSSLEKGRQIKRTRGSKSPFELSSPGPLPLPSTANSTHSTYTTSFLHVHRLRTSAFTGMREKRWLLLSLHQEPDRRSHYGSQQGRRLY